MEVPQAMEVDERRKVNDDVSKIGNEEKAIVLPAPSTSTESFQTRHMQRVNQLPPQDFDPKYCNTLDRREKQAMNKLADIQRAAAGRGKLTENNGPASLSCESCGSVINIGEKTVFARIEGIQKQWHPECFHCFSCHEMIADYIYFLHKGNAYCGRHFVEQYRARCAGCDEIIYGDKYTKAEGKSWHRNHFVCFTCKKNLVGSSYVSHKDQPHCVMCYHMKVADKCKTCCLPIAVGEERITHEDTNWHVAQECFFCHGCNKSLVDAPFLLKDFKTYCSSRCSKN